MLLSDIDSWNVGALQSIAVELGDELTTIEGVASDLELISRLPGWESPAADAARGKIRSTADRVLDDAAVIGAVRQLAEETAAAVATLKTELESVRADIVAQGGLLRLSDTGDVFIDAPADMHDELQPIADNIESRAKALIHQAKDIDADCAEVFANLADGKITAQGASDVAAAQEMGRAQSGLSAPYPPEGEGVAPRDVTAWWDALSEEEQHKVIAEHPDWIGNRDGVPAWARREVNLAELDQEIADAQREVDALPTREEILGPYGTAGPGGHLRENKYDRTVRGPQERLEKALAMREAMSIDGDPSKGYDPNKYLMLLQFPEGREPRAAIAVGNPDEAEHVAVTTPGVGTTPTSLPDMVSEAEALRVETQRQLDRVGRNDEQVSTIAWLGYEPPGNDISVLEAGIDRRAAEAAPDLADFYRGIVATNEHGSDVNLSAFGHSYGSLTTAQALHELGETGVVDNAAFYGSPGLGFTNPPPTEYSLHGTPIRDESDMFLADGHAFVMSAPGDWISGDPKVGPFTLPSAGDLNQFGPNPSSLPLEQLSADATVTPDGVVREGAVGHADYPRPVESPDGEQVLRTPAYNLAVIAAGLADVPTETGEDRLVR
ncbi:alpha/beta hydrolase [Mycolicibacterium thermoresistibile]